MLELACGALALELALVKFSTASRALPVQSEVLLARCAPKPLHVPVVTLVVGAVHEGKPRKSRITTLRRTVALVTGTHSTTTAALALVRGNAGTERTPPPSGPRATKPVSPAPVVTSAR